MLTLAPIRLSIFGYDPEGDADHAVLTYLSEKTPWDKNTGMSEGIEKKVRIGIDRKVEIDLNPRANVKDVC